MVDNILKWLQTVYPSHSFWLLLGSDSNTCWISDPVITSQTGSLWHSNRVGHACLTWQPCSPPLCCQVPPPPSLQGWWGLCSRRTPLYTEWEGSGNKGKEKRITADGQEQNARKRKWIKPEPGEAREIRNGRKEYIWVMKDQEVRRQYQSKCWNKLSCYSRKKKTGQLFI